MSLVCFCGKGTGHLGYCSWKCRVAKGKAEGVLVIAPNNLPIVAVRHDGALLEHEEADHPAYKFPVKAIYVGHIDEGMREDYVTIMGTEPNSDECRKIQSESHALIHFNEDIAISVYEGCTAWWSLESGDLIVGSLWSLGDWRLMEEDKLKIIALTKDYEFKNNE